MISIAAILILIIGLLVLMRIGLRNSAACVPGTFLYAPVGIIVLILLLAGRCRLLFRKTPLLILANEGVHVTDAKLSELGVIPWSAVTHCADFLTGWNKGRELFIYVKDPFTYLNRITDFNQRNRLTQAYIKHGNALLRINVTFADHDLTELKVMIFRLIELNKPSTL